MYYQILPLIITSFLIAILGLVVFLRNIRNKTNIYYLLFTLSVAAWVLTNALFQVEGYQYVMAFLSYGAAALIALFALLFSIRFSNINSKPTNIALVSIALLVTIGAMIPGIVASDVVGSTIITTPALYLYGLYIFVYFGLCVYYLAQSFSKSIGVDRLRSGLVLFGFFLALLVGAFFNLVLPLFNIYDYVNIGPLASLILVSSMAYAIVKHRLFDIRLVVARSLAYILVILTLGLVYGYFVFGFVDQFFPDTGTSTLQQALYTISAVFLVFTFQPLKRFFDKLTNKLFYRDSYNSEDALNRLGKVFVAKSNSFELLDDSLDIIVDTLKVEFGRLIVLGNDGIYKVAHIGSDKDTKVNVTDLEKLEDQITILDEVSGKEVESTLNDMNAYVALKLATSEGLVGYLLLGTKRSGTIYTKQDINLLEILSQELAVAIENAKSYQEIQAFSETLKKEVEDATAKLRDTNERLIKLDEAKDEFISMASHQLRTPLTTVKGYLSMLLEGDAGKLSKKQSEFIDLAFVSSKRMVHLIADMLNVSRISTGKLTIDKEEIDLMELVQEEVNQLHRQAEARDIELTLHKPKGKIPKLVLDETKIRQVVMNFTDNAIYYAPEGKVDVYIESQDNAVEFRVEDNGIGVSKEAQKELFKKFFRAENAKTVRPDGTGLGLYMAKQVIEIQGGEIIFSSEEGKGSVFGFRFNIGSQPGSKDQHQDKEDDSA